MQFIKNSKGCKCHAKRTLRESSFASPICLKARGFGNMHTGFIYLHLDSPNFAFAMLRRWENHLTATPSGFLKQAFIAQKQVIKFRNGRYNFLSLQTKNKIVGKFAGFFMLAAHNLLVF